MLDQVNIGFLNDGDDNEKQQRGQLPLVITPRWETSNQFIQNWLTQNSKWMDQQLLQYGAILLRGFDIESPVDMEQVMLAVGLPLNDTYRGTSPRINIPGTKYVFSAAEVPVNFPIAQHLEMSFLPAPPKRLYFGCLKPSQQTGGETALADFRQVFKDLDPQLRDKFLVKGIRYERTHKKKGSRFTYDVADMLGWPQLFGTDDQAKVEEMCAKEGTPVEWRNHDTFVSITHSNAFQLHPETHEPVWFNHTQVFHWTTFPAELWFAYKRCKDIRLLIHCIFIAIFSIIKYGILGHKMALNATFGDGEPITAKEMQSIRNAIHKNMVFSRWKKGDILILDNFSVSHGRQPTYDKGRKIVVSWADPLHKTNAMTFSTAGLVADETVELDNPQERTPESTLTRSDSQVLTQQISEEINLTKLSENPQDLSDETIRALKKIIEKADESRNAHQHDPLEDMWE